MHRTERHFVAAAAASAHRPHHPVDQAQGMRQMFAKRVLRFIPVVANEGARCGGLVLERLCTAYAAFGLHTLVMDASAQARPPGELAEFDLAEGVERLSSQVSYMAARGLPLRYADARGVCSGLLDVVADAAPHADVVLVHASASELVRLFAEAARRNGCSHLRPLLFSNDLAEGLRDAYAAVKVISQRGGWMAYDLLVCAPARSQQARPVAERLARCADDFLGVAQRSWLQLDPRQPATQDPDSRFIDLAAGLLRGALSHTLSDTAFEQLVSPGAALPSRLAPVLN